MKAGVNNTDRIAIAKLAGAGKSAKEISEDMQINMDVIESFMPKKTRKKKEQVESD